MELKNDYGGNAKRHPGEQLRDVVREKIIEAANESKQKIARNNDHEDDGA